MIWNLLLAHFLGDYLLQTDWMARRKKNFWVLLLHVGVHLGVMVLLTWQVGVIIWPYLIILAVVHLAQDSVKIFLTELKQQARVPFYLIDQIIHYLVIWGIVKWFQANHGAAAISENPKWVLLVLVYLLVTFVWFISERIFNLENIEYLQSLNKTKISRMVTRALMLSIFLVIGQWAIPGVVILFFAPYPDTDFRNRALLTDLVVSFSGMLVLVLAA